VTEANILISIEDVSFSYGDAKVLDRVSFPIRSGDFLSVIGPNGSGKTTLIKIILGLLTPSEGRIRIFGENGVAFTRWEYEDWRIGKLSGGQQQRVFIARAIVNQPHILFLDEPTTGVDAKTQEQFYDMLDELNTKESITIVLVTHDIGVVNKHVSQVACLHQILQYHGSHEEFCQSEMFKKMITEGHHVVSHRH